MEDNIKKTKKIVLVEDEKIIVNIISAKLEKLGYEVKSAYDGITGLELIHQEKPDLLILDMLLPRLNGFSILEQLSKEKIIPTLPVIVISNSGQPVEIDRALKLGVKDYLIKVNFDPEAIIEKVNHIINNSDNKNTKFETSLEQKYSFKVLLVEDDIFISDLLEKKLTQSQIKTFRAMDVGGARFMLANEKIDLILLDIILPGINGITFLKELKTDEKFKKIPVIVLSNLGQEEEIKKGLDAGAEAYMIKAHSTMEEIIKKVSEIIGKHKK